MDDFAYLCRVNAAGGLHSICEDTNIFGICKPNIFYMDDVDADSKTQKGSRLTFPEGYGYRSANSRHC